MNIFINKIEIGAEYESRIYDFWIYGKQGNQEIKIFDSVPFDLRNCINEYADCLICASFLLNPSGNGNYLLSGIILGDYHTFDYWDKLREDTKKVKWIEVKTEYGNILISENEMNNIKLESEDKVFCTVGRFDLLGIKTKAIT